jgi:hypothetical protein
MNAYVQAIRTGRMHEFRRNYATAAARRLRPALR